MTLRIALIGAGDFAHEHAASIMSLPEWAQLVAVVDPNRERATALSSKHNIPACYADAMEMLKAEKPDIVAICTPPHTHASLAIEAMRSGAHVVCEKPLVMSLAELDAIETAERETGRTCTGIFQWRHGAGAQHVKQLIEQGEAGAPMLAVCNTLWYRGAAYYDEAPWRARWAAAGGGVAMTMGIHAMDITLWLMGEWVELQAMTSSIGREVEVDTVALAQVRFASGALGSFSNSTLSPRQESYVRLDLEQLTIELTHLYRYENGHWRFSLRSDTTPSMDEQKLLAHWAQIEGDEAASVPTQWTHILQSLHGQTDTGTRPHDIRSTYDFLASLYKSAATGQPVSRASIQPGDPFYHAMNGGQQP